MNGAANDAPVCDRCGCQPVKNYDVRLCGECFARAITRLSSLQVALLHQTAKSGSIPLAHGEIPAANGLVARGLAVTHRSGRTSSILAARPKYRKGSVRRMHLTMAGAAFIGSPKGGCP